MSELTIAIPTYNRNSQLAATVRALAPQLNDNVKIKIFDNGSDIPVSTTLAQYEAHGIEIVRSDINVGAAGNIIKCFEYCQSELLWVLGDDDLPALHAVELILADFRRYKDAVFIKYDSNLCEYSGFNTADVLNTGQPGLVSNMKSFANFLFLSSGVYRISRVRENIKAAYYFAATFCPHVAIILDYLRVNGGATTVYSHSFIVEWKAPVQEAHKWGDAIVNKSIHDLVYIVEDAQARSEFFNKINFDHLYNYIPARDTVKAYVASDKNERYDLVADYFSSYSFVGWSSRWRISDILSHFIKMSVILYLCNFNVVSRVLKNIFNSRINREKSIYNKFLYSVKETRL